MRRFRITINGKKYEVEVEFPDGEELAPSPSPRLSNRAPIIQEPFASYNRSKPESAARAGYHKDSDTLKAPMNGVILEINVKAGDNVNVGDVVFVLEAMKMKTNVASPKDGTIGEILVACGDTIESGRPLLKYV